MQPESIGRYRIVRPLARGGMAEVYVAQLEGPGGFVKQFAIKVVRPHLRSDARAINRFIDEARILSRLIHPNAVHVVELDEHEDGYFLAMEYVRGESLWSVLRSTRLTCELAAFVVAEAARGLHAAHELVDDEGHPLEVIHRDVSPHNILVGYDGRVKVSDFGVARARGGLHETSTGQLVGKFGYMSPEQATADPIDRRSDIFSLGIVLYEASLRRRLFRGETPQECLAKINRAQVLPPSCFDEDYPPELERVVLRALQRDADDRYPTAEAFARDIVEAVPLCADSAAGRQRLADLMGEVFADKIETPSDSIRPSTDGPVDATASTGAESPNALQSPTPTPRSTQPRQRRGRRALPIAAAVAIAMAALGVVLFDLYGSSPGDTTTGSRATEGAAPEAPQPSTVAKRAPRTISIRIEARPRSATIRIAGRQVSNPYQVRQAAHPGTQPVVIAAPGYRPQRLELSTAESGSWTVELHPEPDAKPGGSTAKTPSQAAQNKRSAKRGRRRRRRRRKRRNELLVNPY